MRQELWRVDRATTSRPDAYALVKRYIYCDNNVGKMDFMSASSSMASEALGCLLAGHDINEPHVRWLLRKLQNKCANICV